jgi:hypothetical protein
MTRYTFMAETTPDEAGDTTFIERTFETDSLDMVLFGFQLFLWHCTFSYVTEVIALTEHGEVSSNV